MSLELLPSAQLGDKSSAEQSAAAPCKVQGGAGKSEAGRHLQGGRWSWSWWGTQPCSLKSTCSRVSEPFHCGAGTGFGKGAETTEVSDPTFHGRDRFQEGMWQQMVGRVEVARWVKCPLPSLADLRLR